MTLKPTPEELFRQVEREDREFNYKPLCSSGELFFIRLAYIAMGLGAIYFAAEFIL